MKIKSIKVIKKNAQNIASGDLMAEEITPEVEADNGQIAPVFYVSIYEVARAYGGPEEGGWWYDAYEYIETVDKFNDEDAAINKARELNDKFRETNEELSSSRGFEFLPEDTDDSQIPLGFSGSARNLRAVVEEEMGQEDISKTGRPRYE